MASHEISSFDTIPQTPTLKKETGPIVSKSRESDPRADAFLRCRQVFWNDTENYPIQDMETFFDFLKTQEKGADCYKVLATCSDETLRKLVDPKEWFDGICNIAWVNQILKQAKADEKKEVADEKKEKVETKQKTLSDIRLILNDNNHKYLSKEYLDVINNDKIPPSSPEFRDAVKSILLELKAQAEKSGDFKEYTSFVDQFHAIGAVSDVEFREFCQDIKNLEKSSKKSWADTRNWSETAIDMDLKKQDYERFGDAYVRFGEKTDEIIRVDEKGGATKRIVSGKSGYAREIELDGFSENREQTMATQEVFQMENDLVSLSGKLGQLDVLIQDLANMEKSLKNLDTTTDKEWLTKKIAGYKTHLKVDENGKSEVKENLEKRQAELQQKKDALQEAFNDSLIRKGDNTVKREQEARDVIDFVDDMGIYVLGVENVERFFELVSPKSASGKINIADGLDKDEKAEIKKMFLSLIGKGSENLFKPNSYRLQEGKTTENIQELLKKQQHFYHAGETPPVKFDDLRLAMGKEGQTATKNTLG